MNAPSTSSRVAESAWLRYGVAILVALAGAAVRLAFLQALEMRVTYITFYPAVMLAALYGGLLPGLVATVISALLADYFWIEPVGQLAMKHPGDWLGLIVFVANCGAISWITGALRRARSRAAHAEAQAKFTAELVQVNEALRQSEERLTADLAALTRMHALSARLLGAAGLQPLLQEVMDAAVAIMAAERGTLQLLEGDSLRIVAYHGHQQPFLEFFASAENRASVCGEALQRGERVVVPDVETSPLFAGTPSLPVLRAAGVRAVQSTPMVSRAGKLIGILTTQWDVPYLPGEHDLWRIDLLVRQAVDLIELREAEETLRRSNERFALLSDVAGRLLAAEDPQGIVNELCADVMRQLDCQVFFNFLADPASGRLRLNACAGIPAEEAAKIEWLDYGVAVCGCVAQEGCRIVAEDIFGTPDVRTELVKSYGIQAYACHPLLRGERVIGTLSFGTRNRTRFSAGELALMKAVADHVAVAMQRKEAEVALRESGARERERAQELQTVLDAVPAAVWIAHDPHALEITGNRLSYDWVKLPQGMNPSQSLPEGERAKTFRVLKDGVEIAPPQMPVQMSAAGADVRDYEFDFVYPDGSVRHVLGNANPLRDERGQPRGSISAFVDITARKQAEQTLRDADRRKDEFLAMLAHELRNPLAPIRNAVHLLRLIGPAEPRLEQARDMIDRQVSHMVRLIDDLLDVSRITRGKISLRKERLDLAEVVAQAAEVAGPLLTRKRQAFTVSCAPEPIEVEADPARLVQVIANLLNNAAKFTEPGGSITLTTERSGDDAIIRVRDTGVGIAPELLPHIFDLFVQGETSLDRTEGGLGIGLTLVRHMVEQHGGRIEAHSAGRGCGSEFVVTWPAAPPAVPASPRAAFVESADPGRRLRILVVEDNVDAAESFVTLLQLQGHEIRAAQSGLAALEVASSFVADVAFIDLGLPGMDGYEVARRLRAIPRFQATVLVALTGYGQEEDKRRSLEAGFDHHLIKPVDPATIDRLLVGIGGSAEARPRFLQ